MCRKDFQFKITALDGTNVIDIINIIVYIKACRGLSVKIISNSSYDSYQVLSRHSFRESQKKTCQKIQKCQILRGTGLSWWFRQGTLWGFSWNSLQDYLIHPSSFSDVSKDCLRDFFTNISWISFKDCFRNVPEILCGMLLFISPVIPFEVLPLILFEFSSGTPTGFFVEYR